ncbi:phosphoribosylformylglycinamidine cyclo-ligase [Candidatus Endolissoclinum faulkneri L5]|uniref:Phosphoribosylformylglycinamidine cyclo-ligase n=1 Tax=Candidatus Endolissoclinum faulkneri L5 TaxID=1401328 RepID=V9TUR6_9PROT|nr:phosphoribosylformylglycinamidine cyclo-ligase [Candidatus Endolissoclinum faulkneri]AHC73897.1 phosphoribosylformylglycinamidine cyclo-ligase [Candidatus Endolissoclinum faulkneri L5]
MEKTIVKLTKNQVIKKDSTHFTYRDAGVNINAGKRLVNNLKPLTASTSRPGASTYIGGFGGLFDPKAAGYSDPILVACTDGVGTKLRIALNSGIHNTIGIDLVAMCVNDLLVHGAEPLIFLDYYATGKLDLGVAKEVITGIVDGCKQAGCGLIGGETAEMPGMYHEGDYELVGFAVGAVKRFQLLERKKIKAGDIVLGLKSSGLHSNGYSLVHQVMERTGITWKQKAPFEDSKTIAESLLAPTKIYVKACLAALATNAVQGFVHITGGGLLENPPRIFDKNLALRLDLTSWTTPRVFTWIAKEGKIDKREMLRTFNCGLGMLVLVRPSDVDTVQSILNTHGENSLRVGFIEQRSEESVVLCGLDSIFT